MDIDNLKKHGIIKSKKVKGVGYDGKSFRAFEG